MLIFLFGRKENQMTRKLKVGDTVYTPCTCFNSGETWVEEKKVKEIGEDFIVLTHVATLRERGENLDREEVTHTEHRGDKKQLDYYSRTTDEIMKEDREQKEWLVNRFLDDAKKYG
ncbi:hypothetical protein OPIT5_00410 (plasmid) [Opitutaceae bacterium TAV5]|nr:hypothetical protein OPIT5_00410 [Opitutaceae bacterium TAV5]